MATREEDWVVGVDRGGTWLRIVALDRRGRRRQARHPAPALAELPAVLRAIWRRWGLHRGAVAVLAVASRGVWARAERLALGRRLRALAPSVRVLSDVEAAYLGALGDREGVLLLAGTGSIALGRDAHGRFVRTGGLGPLLGDDGSAFWIGREWLRSRAGAPSSGSRAGGRDLELARRLQQGDGAAARIAALAPAVLRRARRGDRVARTVVARAQEELAALLTRVARDLGRVGPRRTRRASSHRSARLPVSWAGGLLDDDAFRAGVWRAARRAGLHLAPSAPRGTPLDGALARAARLVEKAERRRPPAGRSRRAQAERRRPSTGGLSQRA